MVADALHQPPHEVNEWPIEWLYKYNSLLAYRNKQNHPKDKPQPEQNGKVFKGKDLVDWE